MYKIETIRNLMDKMAALEKEYTEQIDSIRPCISKGNTKIGNVLNFSLAPIKSCGNRCKVCMHECYDIKACLLYRAVIQARVRNFVMAKMCRDRLFSEIRLACSRRRKNKFFRWHVSGDILDYDYFCRMVETAKMFPEFRFWTYTKNYEFVNQYVAEHGDNRFVAIPENFVIMFSRWDGIEMVNPYGFPEYFAIDNSEEIIDNLIKSGKYHHCMGNCNDCIKGHCGCIYGQSCWIVKH